MSRFSVSTICLLVALAVVFLIMVSQEPSSSMVSAGGYDKGHVHINVWRGPSKGYYKKKFAPWGYYAKLPADESPKYKHYA